MVCDAPLCDERASARLAGRRQRLLRVSDPLFADLGRHYRLRIERKGGTTERRAVMLSGDGGYLGEIKEEKRADITKSEFVALLEDIRKSGFWELSPDDDVGALTAVG